MQIIIKRMSINDAASVRELTQQLGYSLSNEQIRENIKAVLRNADHDAFVATAGDEVVGWIGVKHAFQIEALPFCEIHGLVVSDRYRKHGIGKMLIDTAKQWGKERGNSKLRLRCNVKRTETHVFYQHLGFKETKEQKVYEINI